MHLLKYINLTLFGQTKCYIFKTFPGCTPLVNLDFSDPTLTSSNYQLQGSQAVIISNNEGYFGGNAFIANPQLNNNIKTEQNSVFVIDVTLRFDSSSANSVDKVSLMKSCDGHPDWSIKMYADTFPSKLTTTVRFNDRSIPDANIVNEQINVSLLLLSILFFKSLALFCFTLTKTIKGILILLTVLPFR